ncbi:MAG TPA: isocitrate/isopropylmalate family dehydrogenase, partial [Cerasibacillus sp.]|uniref:isocitrate/isopropylmalate family dehydrogenase n=1 Tax=Cerasibacillus sp. TaxID=2498711 RepID=UPI002F41A61D
MQKYRIAVIAGDGIGPEVIAEGIKAIEALTTLKEKGIQFEFVHLPWGCEYYLREGRMMPEDGMDVLREFDAIYLGAVGYPGVPDHVSLWDLLLIIRKQFDQYINLRPIRLLNGAPTVLKEGTVD